MPSPFAHGIAGLGVHILMSRDGQEIRDPWRIGVTVGAALLPDLDLAFQFVDGANHHGAEFHGIASGHEDSGDRFCCRLGGQCRGGGGREHDRYLAANKIGCH